MITHGFCSKNRQVRVEFMNLLPDGAEKLIRIAVAANQQGRVAVIVAHQREIDEGLGIFADTEILALFDDAKDLPERPLGAGLTQSSADRALTGEKSAGEAFVNNGDPRPLV